MKEILINLAFFIGGLLTLSVFRKSKQKQIDKVSPDKYKSLSDDEKVDKFEELKRRLK
jgi:hypothetical protein